MIIITEFEGFLKRWQPRGKTDARYWFNRFLDVLKVKTPNATDVDHLVHEVYRSTGHVLSRGYRNIFTEMVKASSMDRVVGSYQVFLDRSEGTTEDFCEEFKAALTLHSPRDLRRNHPV
jgi:hypothetical protein